jgi:hypothetical protein
VSVSVLKPRVKALAFATNAVRLNIQRMDVLLKKVSRR